MQTIYMLSEDDQKKDLGKSGQPFRINVYPGHTLRPVYTS